MSRSLGFQFSSLCGVSYDCGDIRFSPSSHSLLSPVGHRLNRFGLTGGGVDSNSETFPFETLSPIHRVAQSKTFLVVVDSQNRGLLCNMDTGAVLHRFTVRGDPCRVVEFSRDGAYLAVSTGRKVQVWKLPEERSKTFSPLVLEHEFQAHSKDVVCLTWTDFGFISGSMDTTAHVQYFHRKDKEEMVSPLPHQTTVSLVGHRTSVLGCFMLERELEEPCVITVSEDGTVFEWRFTDSETEIGKYRAQRKRVKGAVSKDNDDGLKKEWKLKERHFCQPSEGVTITCASSNHVNLLLLGFSNGVFSLVELPSGQKLQTLSASKYALESCAITNDGAWLALASPTLGQLLVWEWKSETFVLKQQGHYFKLNTCAFSPDGRVCCTGGDDGKVKLWSTSTNTCFVTFTEHTGPITGLCFLSNTAICSSSLDGTVRCFDLIRLRNFRTLDAGKESVSVQFTSVACSGSEVVCAGSFEPSNIYLWSLRTGKLLDVLAGHTGPVSSVDFSVSNSLASASWDGTIRLWEPFTSNQVVQTLVASEGPSPQGMLCVSFRPDGKELCSCGLDGNLSFWDVATGNLKSTLECKRDLGLKEGRMTSFFQSLCYSSDGKLVLAGGKSSWVFAYDCERELLLKKYQLAHRVRNKDDGEEDEEGDDARKRRFRQGKSLPGTVRGNDAGKRNLLDPDVEVQCVRFNPTGRSWVACTNQGLVTFSLDTTLVFDPLSGIDENCTPQSARLACEKGDYAQGINQSLFLGEESLMMELLACVPLHELELVARGISNPPKCLDVIARGMEESVFIEYHLKWALALLATLRDADAERYRVKLLPALRAIQKAVTKQEQVLSRLCDENMYDLTFLIRE